MTKQQRAKKFRVHKSFLFVPLLVFGLALAGYLIFVTKNDRTPTKAASGWMSGAASPYAANGSFGTWRGEPVAIAGTWVNGNTYMISLDTIQPGAEYGSWSKPLDIAIGAIDNTKGENWVNAGNGAYDARWRQSAKNFKSVWTNRGKPEGNLYIRFAHEMNGNWYPWSVPRGQENDFKKAWIRWSNIMDQELPDAKKVLSFNKNTVGNSAYSRDLWPGKQYVDIYSIDWYNVYPWCNNDACFASEFNRREGNGNPVGVEAHRQEAEKLGMPFAISEWSNSAPSYANQGGGGGEAPGLMTYMNNWMRAHAGTGSGQLVYEVLFNLWTRYAIYGSEAQQPQTSARYRDLTWGDGGSSGPTPTAPTPPAPAPPTVNRISQTSNLVTGKTFTSSVPDSTTEAGKPVSNINDKNEATRWISQPVNGAYISTDLGATYNLNKVSILWAGDTVKNYEIQISSNNTAWTTVATGSTNNTSPQLIDHALNNASARYFRIWAKDRWNAAYGNSIWELGVYGSAPSTTPAGPVITSFVASPATIQIGQSSVLSWTTTGTTSCSVSPNGPQATSASSWTTPTFTTTGTRTFTLTCANSSGATVSRTATVVVNEPATAPTKPVITSTKTAVAPNESFQVSWISSGASSCSLNPGGSSSSGSSGSRQLSIGSTTTYTVACTNAVGTSTSDGLTVAVSASPAPIAPTIASFVANPANVGTNGVSTLSWVANNAIGCSLDDSPLDNAAPSGSYVTAPLTGSRSFTLTCRNAADQRVNKSVSVTVNNAPAPAAPAPSSNPAPKVTTDVYVRSAQDGRNIANAAVDATVSGAATLDASNIVDADKVAAISRVEYYNGETLIDTVTSAPFALDTTKLKNGTYTITERTYFNDGSISERTQDVTIENTGAASAETPSASKLLPIAAGGASLLLLAGLAIYAVWKRKLPFIGRFRAGRSDAVGYGHVADVDLYSTSQLSTGQQYQAPVAPGRSHEANDPTEGKVIRPTNPEHRDW